ncbi:MAG TPA: hypothetical protein PLL10_00175 [Elusimicrobiales bacterium]|nr:hypothetical protein [Elusimicrobiales bacterium]
MGITFTNLVRVATKNKTLVAGKIAFDSSYASGGEVITPAELGLSEIESMVCAGGEGYQVCYTLSDSKLHVYGASGGGTPTGTIAITPHADSAGTPAGTIVVTPHADSAGTPAGTNAASNVVPNYITDWAGVVKPVIALTHAADPTDTATDSPLYVVEAVAGAVNNCGSLESVCAGAANVIGETADGSVWGGASSARFFVTHNATPGGVQVYVNESESDRLECISPTGTDVYVVMPMEAVAGAPAAAVAVKIHHSATADTGKPVYFNDNGAADAQLVFTDTGAAGGTIPAGDIYVLVGGYTAGLVAGFGVAEAQAFTGNAMGDHSHASTAAFTGAAMADHSHASTAAFTGGAMATGASAEVSGTTDLSGLDTCLFVAIGY